MLTSHHSLLSALAIAFCATGMAYQSAPQANFQPSIQSDLQGLPHLSAAQPAQTKSVDVSYRGSGRIGDVPIESELIKAEDIIAHRGSGRVRPQFL